MEIGLWALKKLGFASFCRPAKSERHAEEDAQRQQGPLRQGPRTHRRAEGQTALANGTARGARGAGRDGRSASVHAATGQDTVRGVAALLRNIYPRRWVDAKRHDRLVPPQRDPAPARTRLVFALVALLVFGEAALFIGFVLPGETSVHRRRRRREPGPRQHRRAVRPRGRRRPSSGDSVGYAIGNRYGEKLLTLPIIAKRRVAIERALEGLRRRGPTYVFVGRFTAFLRAVMPGLAGMSKMHYRRFLVANALGGIIWGVGVHAPRLLRRRRPHADREVRQLGRHRAAAHRDRAGLDDALPSQSPRRPRGRRMARQARRRLTEGR